MTELGKSLMAASPHRPRQAMQRSQWSDPDEIPEEPTDFRDTQRHHHRPRWRLNWLNELVEVVGTGLASLLSRFFRSGQRMQGSSGSPALLEGSEQSLALVTEAKARELLVLGDGGLATQFAPASMIEPGGLRDELLSPGRILLPPLVVGRRAPVAQQIGIPVLAATDAAVARLESTNAALHVVVCPGKVLPVIALHQVRPQVGEHLQELGEALPLQLGKAAIAQVLGHLLTPAIQATSHRGIAHRFSG